MIRYKHFKEEIEGLSVVVFGAVKGRKELGWWWYAETGPPTSPMEAASGPYSSKAIAELEAAVAIKGWGSND
jgi:hypothetical protein